MQWARDSGYCHVITICWSVGGSASAVFVARHVSVGASRAYSVSNDVTESFQWSGQSNSQQWQNATAAAAATSSSCVRRVTRLLGTDNRQCCTCMHHRSHGISVLFEKRDCWGVQETWGSLASSPAQTTNRTTTRLVWLLLITYSIFRLVQALSLIYCTICVIIYDWNFCIM